MGEIAAGLRRGDSEGVTDDEKTRWMNKDGGVLERCRRMGNPRRLVRSNLGEKCLCTEDDTGHRTADFPAWWKDKALPEHETQNDG